MTRKDLYQQLQGLTPCSSLKNDYRETLRVVLQNYLRQVSLLDENERPNIWEKRLADVQKIVRWLNDIAKTSYSGLPSSAYDKMRNVLKCYDAQLKHIVTVEKNFCFYRMRFFENRRTGIGYDEMFHIPLTLRGKVQTQRYSTPGYPCLYLGTSIYGCWEEMHRPVMYQCWVSHLKNVQPLSLFDLRFPNITDFENNFPDYLYRLPFVLACMIPVKNIEDVYKPEYIIPQLLIEWVIKTKSCDGIFYTSSHKNHDFDFPDDKHDNVAIPVKNPLSKGQFCENLRTMFQITDPANNEIEQLRDPYPIDEGGAFEHNPNENYRTSDLGYLETRLQNVRYFPLHSL